MKNLELKKYKHAIALFIKEKLLSPIISIFIALFIGGLIIVLLGGNVSLAMSALFNGAFGSFRNFGQTLLSSTPLLFTGLSFAVAYRAGLFNIGAEGQFYMGAISGAVVGLLFPNLPPFFKITLVLASGALFGALWAFIPGILKVKFELHEVIVVIMLNKIAIGLTNFLVSGKGPFRLDSTLPATPFVSDNARLQPLFEKSPMNIGFFIGILISAIMFIILWKTVIGYRMRAVGFNKSVAQFSSINTGNATVIAFMISGAIAGIGGAMEISSVYGRFYAQFSPGYGFEGIPVSLLAGNHPIGIIFTSILFGALKTGALRMQIIAGTNADLVKVIQGLVIFLIASHLSISAIQLKLKSNKSEKIKKIEARKKDKKGESK
jgi:simple sugar transport system permease protein